MAKKYDNGDGVEHINLKVYEGEIVTFLGPSGCGKSTILRTIGGRGYPGRRTVYREYAAGEKTDRYGIPEL